MNENATSNGFSSWLFSRKLLWLAIIPLAAMLFIASYFGVQEWKANQATQLQISQWEQAGIPYNNATLQESYDGRTSPEGYEDWAKVIPLLDWGAGADAYNRLPILGYEGKIPTELIPGDGSSAWDDEALVVSYLDEMKPVIDLIEQASKHPTPVRFPIQFQGFGTLLPHAQQSRHVVRVLSLDCDYAYSQQDTARALRDLSLIQSTADAFDNRKCIVTVLVNVALRGVRHNSIRRTLTHSVWDETELATLRESLSVPDDFPARWQEAIAGERAMTFATINESSGELMKTYAQSKSVSPIWPSDKQTLIDFYDDAIQLPVGSMQDWRERATALRKKVQTVPENSVTHLFFPAVESALQAGIRTEETRRWTLTAVALQQYKQQHGKWPEKLSNLESLGLTFADYSNSLHVKFGYEVDGESAYLWTSDFATGKSVISPTRPIPKEGNEEHPVAHMLQMRSAKE